MDQVLPCYYLRNTLPLAHLEPECQFMFRDNSRLILELDKHRREINRSKINPSLPTVDIDTVLPVVNVCAKARADYIECLMRISRNDDSDSILPEQIEELKQYRLAYEELVCAANALETVIKRDYVEVNEN